MRSYEKESVFINGFLLGLVLGSVATLVLTTLHPGWWP